MNIQDVADKHRSVFIDIGNRAKQLLASYLDQYKAGVLEPEHLHDAFDALDGEYDTAVSSLDKEWFGACRGTMEEFEMYNSVKAPGYTSMDDVMACIRRYGTLTVKSGGIDSIGDKYSVADFVDMCKMGGFVNSDGYGVYTLNGNETNIEVHPSDIIKFGARTDADGVLWFNK